MQKATRDGLIDFGKRLKDKVGEDDIGGAAAEIAYRFFLALFPFFIFIAALGGFIARATGLDSPTDEVMNLLGDALPEDASSVLRTQLEGVIEEQNAGLLSIGAVGALWAAASGVNALVKHLNRVYTAGESRSFIVKAGISLSLTIVSAGLILVAFLIFFVGQLYGPEIAGELGLEDTATALISFARWPFAALVVMLAVAILYWLAPNRRMRFGWLSAGTAFFAISWLLGSFLFGLYVSNFGSYNATYGALGGVVIMLTWFYVTAFLVLAGAEVNAVLAEKGTASEPETAAESQVKDSRGSKPTRSLPQAAFFAGFGLLALFYAIRGTSGRDKGKAS